MLVINMNVISILRSLADGKKQLRRIVDGTRVFQGNGWKTLRKLDMLGFIKKTKLPDRKVTYELTERGRRLYDVCREVWENERV